MFCDFKVKLDIYNLFLDDSEKVDEEYLDIIGRN